MGIEHQVISGTGFTSLFPQESPQGTPGATGYNHKPVARWTHIAGDTHRDSENIYVGLMAFHGEGIKEVEFFLNDGDGVKVTEQEINPTSGLPEYFVKMKKSDILNKMGDAGENIELRAVIRPVTGQVKILQHDKDEVRGDLVKYLVTSQQGVSGGVGADGEYFWDRRTHPGEHSYVATATDTDYTVYVSPNGDNAADGLTRSTPVKHITEAVRKLRNLIRDTDSSRVTEETSTNDLFVDISNSTIILLPGTYTRSSWNIGTDSNPNGWVGNGDPGSEKTHTPHGYLTITGDPTVSRDQIILRVGDDDRTPPKGVSEYNHFNISRPEYINLSALKCKHFTVIRDNTTYGDSMFSFGTRGLYRYPNGIKPVVEIQWFDDIEVIDYTIRDPFTMTSSYNGIPVVLTNSKIVAAEAVVKRANIAINNEHYKTADDLFRGGVIINQKVVKSLPTTQTPREIRFEEGSEYEKFNGWYFSVRDDTINHLKNSTALDNTNFVWLEDVDGLSNKQYKIGTIWRRLKEDKVEECLAPFYDPEELTDPNQNNFVKTYGELKQNYFEQPYFLGYKKPLFSKGLYSNAGVQTAGKTSIEDIYDDFYMACLYYDNPTGFTAGGFFLFDSSKPLVFGSDSNPNTQKYLFRNSEGVSGSISGWTASFNNDRVCGNGNFANKVDVNLDYYYSWAEGVTTPECIQQGGQVTTLVPVSSGIPEDLSGLTNSSYPILSVANGGEDDGTFHQDVLQTFITPENYSGGYGIQRKENMLYAYNTTFDTNSHILNSGYHDIAHCPVETAVDIAFINNTFQSRTNQSITSTWSLPVKNMLLLNNTILNEAINLDFGLEVFGPNGFGDPWNSGPSEYGTTGQTYITDASSNSKTTIMFKEYLNSIYPTGVTIDLHSGPVYIKNNYFDSMNGQVFTYGLTTGETGSIAESTIVENNYYWPYTELYSDLNFTWASRLYGPKGPKFENYEVVNGGANYVQNTQYSFVPMDGSGLIGGGSAGNIVPFDSKMQRRIEKSTIGAYEPYNPTSYSPAPVSYTSTNTTFNLEEVGNEMGYDGLYGKLVKIEAIKDGETLISGNTFRLNSQALEEESPYATDISEETIYEFDRDGSDTRGRYNSVYREETLDENGVSTVTEYVTSNDWLAAEHGIRTMSTNTSSTSSAYNQLWIGFREFSGDQGAVAGQGYDQTIGENIRNSFRSAFSTFVQGVSIGITLPNQDYALIDHRTEQTTWNGQLSYHLMTLAGASYDFVTGTEPSGSAYGNYTINRPT